VTLSYRGLLSRGITMSLLTGEEERDLDLDLLLLSLAASELVRSDSDGLF